MASMRDIKRRKASIQSTGQITKAMKLVSTVKLQKSRQKAEGSKPYTIRMVNMHATEAVNGFVVIEGNDSIITPDANASVIEIKF